MAPPKKEAESASSESSESSESTSVWYGVNLGTNVNESATNAARAQKAQKAQKANKAEHDERAERAEQAERVASEGMVSTGGMVRSVSNDHLQAFGIQNLNDHERRIQHAIDVAKNHSGGSVGSVGSGERGGRVRRQSVKRLSSHLSAISLASLEESDDGNSANKSIKANDTSSGDGGNGTGTNGVDDYGWLRQLNLRSDIPSWEELLSWEFDVLAFEEETLIQVFVKLLEYYELLITFGIERHVMENYGRVVMSRHYKDCYYQKVDLCCGSEESEGHEDGKDGKDGNEETKEAKIEGPEQEVLCEYHNWYHAVSAAHTSFLFLTRGGADQFLQPNEIFCIILGALIHDMDHPGTNNDFEVKRKTELANRYNGDAVLERHSIHGGLSLCLEQMRGAGDAGVNGDNCETKEEKKDAEDGDLNWLRAFKGEEREYVEMFITESILATDPARHAGVVKDALDFIEKGPQEHGMAATSSSSTRVTPVTPANPQSSNSASVHSPSTPTKTYFTKQNPTHRLFLGRLILHCADISNPLHSSFQVARDWAIRVTTEFSKQATLEKQYKLPVTSFMDGLDSEYKIAKLQIGFFNFMVKPLFQAAGVLLPGVSHLEEWGERNCVEYGRVIEGIERRERERKEMVERSLTEESAC